MLIARFHFEESILSHSFIDTKPVFITYGQVLVRIVVHNPMEFLLGILSMAKLNVRQSVFGAKSPKLMSTKCTTLTVIYLLYINSIRS